MKSTNTLLIVSLLAAVVLTTGAGSSATSIAGPFDAMLHIAHRVEEQIYSQLKMTTRELTLNLSGISFPGPGKQGDNLNLSALHIPGATTCGDGYLLKGAKCELADLLLMQDLDAQNLILGSLNLEQLKTKQQEFVQNNPNFSALKCTGEKPYLSKQGCVSCSDPFPYFNLQTFQCAKCPDGSTYSAEIRNCQKGGHNFLSNLENNNYLVLSQKSLSKYREQYKQLKEKDTTLEICPEDKPFSTGGECITCPEDTPLFFLPARTCTKCRDGSTFNAESNLCTSEGETVTVVPKTPNGKQTNQTEQNTETTSTNQTTETTEQDDSSNGGQKWTVEKGLSNIFGWNQDQSTDIIDKANAAQGNQQVEQSESSGDAGQSRKNSTRTVVTTKTTTRTNNRSIRKQTDSEDEPEENAVKSVAVEPVESKDAEDTQQK